MEVPDDWEMLQFSRSPENGSCAFADRYQFRLEVRWNRLSGTPDIERMVSDHCSQLQLEHAERVRQVQQVSWRGVVCEQDEERRSRFVHFFPASQRLVEVIFCWSGAIDKDLEKRVLTGLLAHPPPGEEEACPPAEAASQRQRWRTFGMDFSVPPAYELEDCRVEPGLVEMRFTESGGERQERFGRRGMVEHWLNCRVEEWLREWVPETVRIEQQGTVTRRGHEVAWLRGRNASSRIFSALRKTLACEAMAWICPDDGRIYSRLCVGGLPEAQEQAAAGNSARLVCCEGMGA